jgi:hypothetical protein
MEGVGAFHAIEVRRAIVVFRAIEVLRQRAQ